MPPVDLYLLRGLARESAHWGDFPEKLQSLPMVHSVTGVDLLGSGKFYKLSSPLTIRENAEFVLSQIPQETKRHQVVLSISLGSMVAVEMAQLQPKRFSKIFVTNSSFSNLSPFYHRLQLAAFRHFVKIGRSQSLEDREAEVLKMVSRDLSKHKDILKSWVEIGELRPMSLQNFFRQLIAAGTYRVAQEAPLTPIVVLNSEGDEMVHPSCSQKLAEHWNLPLFTHPSSGHDIFIDDPEWALSVVEKNLS